MVVVIGMTLQSTCQSLSNSKLKDDRRITINVSGKKFVTWEKTLRKHPSTLLGSDRLMQFFDETKREFFLDRDPHMFRYILNFYRCGKLHTSSEDCYSAFKEELGFYGIPPENIESCCWEDNTKISIRKPHRKNPCRGNIPSYRGKIWLLMEDPNSSFLGAFIQCIIGVIICISILFSILETIRNARGRTLQQSSPTLFTSIDSICIGFFTLEYLLRLFAAPNRLQFITNKLSIIDLLTIVPFYVDVIVTNFTSTDVFLGDENPLTLLRILRVVRMLKLSRHTRHMRVVGRMFRRAVVDLGFLFFGFFLTNLLFSTVIYYCERGQAEGKFTSIPDTMWYTIVTMMTLGEKDLSWPTLFIPRQKNLMTEPCNRLDTLII
ncbi:potassium voltage-gated channel subfamily D member 3 isoform X2 [Nematostella vectensis]|uniref:potassium voltage-gated channel subfamily D member 3 isoform X2 n=1 Tax=Nematostella vectensis TaxID=45351 RepID=UPI0013905FF0|nr:potassium voltage-gated channel subfamily D member 3 isoform X2 [Nematostella vectensis]